MAFDRNKMKSGLRNRTKESHDRRDDTGRFKSIFEEGSNLDLYKCKDAEHSMNVIPYIAGKMNPTAPEGEPSYYLDLWVHRKIGPSENNYVCMLRTFKDRGFKCPVCEHQAALKKTEGVPKKEIDFWNPTRRAIYNVQVLDSDAEMAKVMVWDVSHFLFEKKVAGLAKLPKGGGFIYFSDPDDGKTLFFTKKTTVIEDKNGNKMNSIEFDGLRFLDRTAPLADDILAKAVCIEDKIHWPTYEEVYEALYQSKSKEDPAQAGDDNGGAGDEQEQPAPAESAPAKPEPLAAPDKPASPAPEQPSHEAARTREYRCPDGGVFGKDNGTYAGCDGCRLWEPCEAKYKELTGGAQAATSAEPAVPPAKQPAPPPPPPPAAPAGGVRRRPGR